MGFVHSKLARLFMDQYELTSDFNDFTFAAKAGIAETTVYGRGAKTYIGGLLEGQISAKAFFDDAVNGEDFELTTQLGNSTNTTITFIPSGKTSVGTRAVVSEAAATDYSITAPVANVVGVSATWQADNGLKTGVILWDSTPAYTTAGTTIINSTTVAAGSNGVNTNTFLGAGVLNVVNTAGFPTSGTIVVPTGTSVATLSYTGTTGTTFTGVTTLFGGGALATGGLVSLGTNDRSVVAGTTTNQGLIAIAHILTLTGTVSPTVAVKLQHSDDGVTWVDLVTLSTPATTASGPEAVYGIVPANITINRLLRAAIATAGSTISTTVLVSAARM
jgi:hypothetical protein